MVKFIISFIKIFMAAIIALLFSSCNYNINIGNDTVKGNGNVVIKTRTVNGDFTGIKVSQGLEVIVEQGPEVAVVVEADENLHEEIITKVEGNVLVVRTEKSIRNAEEKKIYVRMPKIKSLKSSSSGSIEVLNTIKTNSLDLTCSSAGEIEAVIEAGEVTANTSSAGEIELKGRAESLITKSSSGSTIKAKDLVVKDVESKASSGSSTEVNPVESFKAKASSGSSIRYVNEPLNHISKKTSSGGSIKR